MRTPEYWVGAEDLRKLFGYKTRRCLYQAIRLERLPVETFKFGGQIYADKEAVRTYFRQQRDAALSALGNGGDDVAG